MERGKRFLQVVSTVAWLVVTAQIFLVADLAYTSTANALTASFRVGNLEVSLGDFALFGLMVWLALVLSRFVRFVLEEDVLSRTRLPRGVPFAISTIARYVVVLIGFLFAAAAAGFDVGRFTIVAGALGVGIGIGLQNVVNNFVSGMILLFERPIQLGDSVDVGGVSGTVRRIGMRSSTVRTYDGAEVVIPNAEFISNQFTNWTLSDRNRRVRLPIGIAYGSQPDQVIELLLGAAKGNAKIRPHPAPEAFFLGFGESALNFELRVWVSNFDDAIAVQSELSMAVNAALREAGISVPFPQRDLHLRVSNASREEK
jgi:small-conductance mechanosensitive channel